MNKLTFVMFSLVAMLAACSPAAPAPQTTPSFSPDASLIPTQAVLPTLTRPPGPKPTQPSSLTLTPSGESVLLPSPDGRWTAVFNLKDNRFEIEDSQGGGKAVDDLGQAVIFGNWSPDSRFLLYWQGVASASIQADGLPLWLVEAETGQTHRLADAALVNHTYHSWAPDGNALAFTNGGYRSAQVDKWLSRYEVASGQVTTLVPETELVPGQVAWSPAGNTIAFAAVKAGETGMDQADWMSWDNPAIRARRIYLLDPQNGGYRRLNQVQAYQDAPRWSADGKTLYHVQIDGDRAALMAADPATGEAQPLPGCQAPLPEAAGYYGQVDWSALYENCQAEAFSTEPGQPSIDVSTPPPTPTATPGSTITGQQTSISPTVPEFGDMDLSYQSWISPDGQWIAELLHASPFENTVNIDQEYLRLTVSRTDQSLAWAILDEWRDIGLGAAYPAHFQWTPDGRYVYFFSSGVADGCGTPFDNNLLRLDLANGSLVDQTPYERSRMGVMSVSPDGSLLAYIGPYPTNSDLIFRDLATGQERRVSIEPPVSEDWSIGALLWSPEGDQLVFTRRINYCHPASGMATSIVWVDLPSSTARTLIAEDGRLLHATKWPASGKPVLSDQEGQLWELDVPSGALSPAPPDELGQARDTLIHFFELLKKGDYTGAASLYGGSYEELIDKNPDLDPQNSAGLLRNACQMNGYQCLQVRDIVDEATVSPVEFHFNVEFLNRDGNRFERGPCCGATEAEMPTVWQFPYTVKKVDGELRVMELPVYVP